ncbi:MAG: tyrosine-protein phosphatase [Magnetococcales bacterium]|nr:tyrosine-protein phosphatase [Magnetococcales bacterium]
MNNLRNPGATTDCPGRSLGNGHAFDAEPGHDTPWNGHGIGLNLRPLAEGENVCHGLFRTGDVTILRPDQARRLRDHGGIRFFLDLRGESELRRYGRALSLEQVGIAILNWPVMARDASAITGRRPGNKAYARYYFSILDDMAAHVSDLFAWLAALKGAPLLFGCHAGKDRTSLVAMLLLHVLGANTPVIARDHEQSGAHLLPHLHHFRDKWERKGETPEEYAVRLDARGETMRQTLEMIEEAFGGIGAWLKQCGVQEHHLQAIRLHYGRSTMTQGPT